MLYFLYICLWLSAFLLVEIKFIKRVSYTCIYLDSDCVGVCVEGICSDTCKYELSCTLGRTCQGGKCFYPSTDNTACPSDGQICHHGVCKEGCQVNILWLVAMTYTASYWWLLYYELWLPTITYTVSPSSCCNLYCESWITEITYTVSHD